MDVTGGSYMSQPYTNSEAVKWAMRYPVPEQSPTHIWYDEPYPPYATAHGDSWGRPMRPYSAPMRSEYMIAHPPSVSSGGHVRKRNNESITKYLTQRGPGLSYNPLYDAHLQEYYEKRFGRLFETAERRNEALLRKKLGMRRSSDTGHGKSISLGKEVIYKVAVTTGTKKNCGTSAKVYVKINGSHGHLPRTRLWKRSVSNADEKNAPYKFATSSIVVFLVKTSDLGDLRSIVVEHDGKEAIDSWFLDNVEIHNTKSRKSWLFVCDRWLSRTKGDRQTKRELFAKKSAKTEYEVVVVTGDKLGAGTDANVYFTLFGKSGKTQKLQLRNPGYDCFTKNRSDIFTVKANCVGPMTKVRVEHDNTGTAPGWYLERIVVTDVHYPKWKYFFACGQWLSKTEGDGCISRDLVGSKNPLASQKGNKYKVTVHTGDKRGAGTDANVYICLFGEQGESGQKLLSNTYNNFERGRKDEFIISTASVGRLTRIRIGHDNSGPSPGWYLDRVIVDDLANQAVHTFPCERWLARDEDDGQTSRDLVPGKGGAATATPGVPYEVSVSTGNEAMAGTSARVFVILYGGKGGDQNSGKIWLDSGKFARGKTDIFHVETAVLLSPLSRIDIGHDNSGSGPGWFLDRVVVKCPSAGVEQTFACNKWLAVDEADGIIERTLLETKSLRKEGKKLVTWQVWVYTSDVRGAGTDANVSAVLYGKHPKTHHVLKTDVIPLDNKGNNFESGKCDKFKVDVADVGTPFKLRIGHDNKGSFAAWHLDRVELENMSTGEHYIFKCKRWLALNEDDGAIVRELPAEGPGIKNPLPLKQYMIQTYTGDKLHAGTDANVFINLFGEMGDTGERALTKTKNKNKFERNQMDEFVLEAVVVDPLQKIRIGHDGSRPGSGWFLDKVVVAEMGKAERKMTFDVNRWFDLNEDDGLTVREITAGGVQSLNTTSYHVSVKTGDCKNAGTDANVRIRICGDQGDTGDLQLKRSDAAFNKFERGRTDTFKLEATDIGKLEKMKIGHDNFLPAEGWYLDEVRIDIPSKGEFYSFACHRWLDKGEADGLTELELVPTEVRKGAKYIPYEITIWTGDVNGAGTDANVFIQMYGETGKTEKYQLRNRTNNFERNQIDKFKIEATPVGHLQKIRIGHDGSGAMSGWFLHKVLIQCPKQKQKQSQPHSSPIARKRSLYHDVDDRRDMRRGSPDVLSDTSRLRGKDSKRDLDETDSPHRHVSPRKDSLHSSKRDLDARPDSARSHGKDSKRGLDNDDSPRARRASSGRDLIGRSERGRSQSKSPASSSRLLSDSASDDDRERVRERSTNTSQSRKDDDFESYYFFADSWFARSEGDGQIVREFLPTTDDGKMLESGLKQIEYTVHVKTGDVAGSGTDANVFIQLTGELGDSGEHQLKKTDSINKFERNQTDVFKIKAVELGRLKKLKIRHDNKGGAAAWFLDYIEVETTKSERAYFFPCQRWLSPKEDDGQIMRELVPVDPALKSKLAGKDKEAVRKEIGLEQKAALTTYHVYVTTGNVFGAGTDANVHIFLYGEKDDSGKVSLKSSKTNKNKFERNQTDEFIVEAAEIGELRKIAIGVEDSGAGSDWFLEKVAIDCPSLGKKWTFPCGRWLAKTKDDGKLERELFPQDQATEEYVACIPYEITTYTSDVSGASTDANVFIVVYGRNHCTDQKNLCSSKTERKQSFKRNAMNKFILELEDVGEPIEKIRIGHDGTGLASGWHLDRVQIRRLKEGAHGSSTYTFKCGRWLAKNEEDGAIVRELVPENIVEERTGKDGATKRSEIKRKDTLKMKSYEVDVYTGDVKSAGTDANVFITIFGDKGDSGERQLMKSETNKDKFERGKKDVFRIDAADLGKCFKIHIRHDNSMLNPSWFLDRVEVRDNADNDVYVFHCERWLGKNKDDGKLSRSLYVKGYDGDMSSTSTIHSSRFGGSMASLDSARSSEPFSKSPRLARRQTLMEVPENGVVVPYTVRIHTGADKDAGTTSDAYIKLMGPKKKLTTGTMYLKLAQKKGFEPNAIDTFSIEALDVETVEKIEVGHDGTLPGSGWYIDHIEVDMPTKGRHYYFHCHQWLAVDKGDGLTRRVFSVDDGSSSVTMYKAKISYEITVFTGDVHSAGTDSGISMTVFGLQGASCEITLDKMESRFERAQSDTIKMELDDIEPLKKLRVKLDGQGSRPQWYLEKVNFRNNKTGDMTVFVCQQWLSASKDDGKLVRDLPALVKGVEQVKRTDYKVTVKTSEQKGSGTSANVYVTVFGEHGDTGEVRLVTSETNKSPFDAGQSDTFTLKNYLSLGELTKLRVWHDNKGFGPAWHLASVEVTDTKTGRKFTFPCDKWLSKSDDDKQIYRELTCSTKALSPGNKATYEIKVTTSDKNKAGMIHNGWIILEGENKSSKTFIMENGAKNKVLRRGQTDTFKMTSKHLGKLKSILLGAVQRDDKKLDSDAEDREAMWHCHEVVITDKTNGSVYTFLCKQWIAIADDLDDSLAKRVPVKDVHSSQVSVVRQLAAIKYEVIVLTGNVRGAGTDANVCITMYGQNGDTGKRELKQALRDLFERGQTDKFQIEALDLGDLTKIRIEHDNAGFGAGWYLERVEIVNLASNKSWSFPCRQWLDKNKCDGLIYRELLPEG